MAMAIAAWVTLGPSSAATASPSIRGGKANSASISRIRKLSRKPPKNPAMSPIGNANATEITMTRPQMCSSFGALAMIRLRMSRPMLSVPRRWSRVGPWLNCTPSALGLKGSRVVAKTATTTTIATHTSPTIPALLRQKRLTNPRAGATSVGPTSAPGAVSVAVIPSAPLG